MDPRTFFQPTAPLRVSQCKVGAARCQSQAEGVTTRFESGAGHALLVAAAVAHGMDARSPAEQHAQSTMAANVRLKSIVCGNALRARERSRGAQRILDSIRGTDGWGLKWSVALAFFPLSPVVLGGHWVYAKLRRELFAEYDRGFSAPVCDTEVDPCRVFSRDMAQRRPGGTARPSGVVYGRLRSRARWVRALEGFLGGRKGVVATLVKGRWVPDLPGRERGDVQNYILGSIHGGAKFLGGGTVAVRKDEEDGDTRKVSEVPLQDRVYFIVDTGDEEPALVFPELLGKLRTYALFRERDSTLLGALRTRAQQWCRARRFDAYIMDLAVASASSMAMMPSTHEQVASVRAWRAVRKAGKLSPPLLR